MLSLSEFDTNPLISITIIFWLLLTMLYILVTPYLKLNKELKLLVYYSNTRSKIKVVDLLLFLAAVCI